MFIFLVFFFVRVQVRFGFGFDALFSGVLVCSYVFFLKPFVVVFVLVVMKPPEGMCW